LSSVDQAINRTLFCPVYVLVANSSLSSCSFWTVVAMSLRRNGGYKSDARFEIIEFWQFMGMFQWLMKEMCFIQSV